MKWWVLNQLRDMVISDIRNFVPEGYFDEKPDDFKFKQFFKSADYLSNQFRWAKLAGKLAHTLSINPNIMMSPRERAASDLLLDLANLASAEVMSSTTSHLVDFAYEKGISCGNADVAKKQVEEVIAPAFTKNFHITFRQYVHYLNDLELKPFSELLLTIDNPVDLERYSFKLLNVEDVKNITSEIIHSFKDLVENKGLWKSFWINDDNPLDEKYAQRLFYGIAHSYCVANNLEVSPEVNSGRGPVDFKFSQGYDSKLIVEIKMSTNALLKGYLNQLEVYKQSNGTDEAIYLVIDIGELTENKVRQLEDAKAEFLCLNGKASDIVIVDAKKKLSASKVTCV